jgi:hypothetical protein
MRNTTTFLSVGKKDRNRGRFEAGFALYEAGGVVMRKVLSLFTAALLLTLTAAAAPAPGKNPNPIAMVNGGGTADFVATPNSANTSGFTEFSVGVTVYDDGSAHGHFLCTMPGVVTISGDVLAGVVKSDGSVTITGIGHGYDHFLGATFSDMPFSVRFYRGAAGVGGFNYRDESGFFGPGQFDTQVVSRGTIRIVP